MTGEVLKQALKAVLIASRITFPPVHDRARLLTLIEEAGEEVPPSVERAARLTRFAVATRYPGFAELVRLGAYEEAVEIAEQVVGWANGFVSRSQTGGGA